MSDNADWRRGFHDVCSASSSPPVLCCLGHSFSSLSQGGILLMYSWLLPVLSRSWHLLIRALFLSVEAHVDGLQVCIVRNYISAIYLLCGQLIVLAGYVMTVRAYMLIANFYHWASWFLSSIALIFWSAQLKHCACCNYTIFFFSVCALCSCSSLKVHWK